ncbi:flagellar hook-length control protein FliK [Derxia gummosa]|uniref:Flagellar hook-length control protein FliK n=1 Tax=Derxia gummosa DSM 723 TaxID=1121388 RepID=A0A8B6X874_9BURK|nr:flagellar hook-length control protein FliK [Derxia gummosa]
MSMTDIRNTATRATGNAQQATSTRNTRGGTPDDGLSFAQVLAGNGVTPPAQPSSQAATQRSPETGPGTARANTGAARGSEARTAEARAREARSTEARSTEARSTEARDSDARADEARASAAQDGTNAGAGPDTGRAAGVTASAAPSANADATASAEASAPRASAATPPAQTVIDTASAATGSTATDNLGTRALLARLAALSGQTADARTTNTSTPAPRATATSDDATRGRPSAIGTEATPAPDANAALLAQLMALAGQNTPAGQNAASPSAKAGAAIAGSGTEPAGKAATLPASLATLLPADDARAFARLDAAPGAATSPTTADALRQALANRAAGGESAASPMRIAPADTGSATPAGPAIPTVAGADAPRAGFAENLAATLAASAGIAPQTAGGITPASGPTASAALAAPVGSDAWGEQLAGQVTRWTLDGIDVAELTLNPKDLGPIQVEIALTDGKAAVHFAAEQAETRAAIDAQMFRLGDSLADAGITLQSGTSGFESQGQAFGFMREQARDGGGARGGNARDGGFGNGNGAESEPAAAITAPVAGQRRSGLDLFA